MRPKVLYRTAAVLLMLFCVGHTLGFRRADPSWHADGLVSAMKATQFSVQGFQRSYWDFYVGFGLIASLLLLLAAVVSWQLGGLEPAALQRVKGIGWTLALCFALDCVLSWGYFFVVPVVFSVVVTICLALASWSAGKTA